MTNDETFSLIILVLAILVAVGGGFKTTPKPVLIPNPTPAPIVSPVTPTPVVPQTIAEYLAQNYPGAM